MQYLVLALLASVASAIQYSDVGMLCLVNKERRKCGLKALGLDPRLTKAAVGHSQDQARMGQMSHTGSDGSSPSNRIQKCGVNWRSSGENVAYGYRSMEEVMNTWMNSPGHRANILGSQFTMFGSGIGTQGSTVYFTQDFANDGQGTRNVPKCDGSDQGSANGGNDGAMNAMDSNDSNFSGGYGGDMGGNYSGGDMGGDNSGGDMGGNYSGGNMGDDNSSSGGYSRDGNNYGSSQGQDDNMSSRGGKRHRHGGMDNNSNGSFMGGRGGNQGGHHGGHRNGRGGSHGGSSEQGRGGNRQSRGGSYGGGHRGGY